MTTLICDCGQRYTTEHDLNDCASRRHCDSALDEAAEALASMPPEALATDEDLGGLSSAWAELERIRRRRKEND